MYIYRLFTLPLLTEVIVSGIKMCILHLKFTKLLFTHLRQTCSCVGVSSCIARGFLKTPKTTH